MPGKWIGGGAARPGPVLGRHRAFATDPAVGAFGFVRRQCCLARVERRRPVGHGIGVGDQRLRSGTAGIDDTPPTQGSGDGGAVRIVGHRHGGGFPVRPGHRAAGVVALPAATQSDIAHCPFGRHDGDPAAAIGHVMPQQVAALREVDRFDDLESGDIFDHAALVSRRQVNVLNDGVVRILRIDLAIGAAGQGFIRPGGSEAGAAKGGRGPRFDDDPDDAALSRRAEQGRHRGGRPNPPAPSGHVILSVETPVAQFHFCCGRMRKLITAPTSIRIIVPAKGNSQLPVRSMI